MCKGITWGSCLSADSDGVCLRWDLRLRIADKLLGASSAALLGTTL